MPALTEKARHLTQLLAEELDRSGGPWTALLNGNGLVGKPAWDWRIDLGEGQDEDWYEANPGTNLAE